MATLRENKRKRESRKGLSIGISAGHKGEPKTQHRQRMKCMSCCFYLNSRPTTSSGAKNEKKRDRLNSRGRERRKIPDRRSNEGGGRRAILSKGWNTPEIPDRVKIIARLFKHLTDRPRTPAAFCSLFVVSLVRKCTPTRAPFSRISSTFTLSAAPTNSGS